MSTYKQKKAFNEFGVNGGNISKAMRTSGYSEEVSKRTDKLTNTKGWQELMEEHIPQSLIAQKHKALLNKTDEKGEIDVQAVSKGVDMGHKLWGSYAPDKLINLNITHEQTPEALALAEKYEEELKKTL